LHPDVERLDCKFQRLQTASADCGGAVTETKFDKWISAYKIADETAVNIGDCKYVRALHVPSDKYCVLKFLETDEYENKDIKPLRAAFKREVDLMRKIVHPNIARYRDSFLDDKYCVVYEDFPIHKTIYQLVTDTSGLGAPRACRIGSDICAAIEKLHSMSYMHGNITPFNVAYGKDGAIVFDLMNVLRNEKELDQARLWEQRYIAPEVRGGEYFAESDLYSVGYTIVFALSRKHPGEYIMQPSIGHPDLVPFLRELTHTTPEKRLNDPAIARVCLLSLHNCHVDDGRHVRITDVEELKAIADQIRVFVKEIKETDDKRQRNVLGLLLRNHASMLPTFLDFAPWATMDDEMMAEVHAMLDARSFLENKTFKEAITIFRESSGTK